jgi:hypothetical protein
MRPRQRAEGEHKVCAFAHGLIQAIGAADDEAHRAHAVVAPASKPRGKGFACFTAPAFIQRHKSRARGHRRQQGFALARFANVHRQVLFDFDFLQLNAPGQAGEVAVVKIALGPGLRLAHGRDHNLKRAGGQERL